MNKLLTGASLAALLALPAAAQVAGGVARTDTDIAFARPTVAVDGYTAMDEMPDALAEVDDLADADLYSSISGDEIGEVEDIVADASGQIRYVELDVGGFLGLGEKHVLVPFEEIRVMTAGDDDYRVYIEATEEQLGQYPEYDD